MKKIFIFLLSLFCFENVKSDPISWSFSTVISTPGLDASEPQIAVDNLGNSSAVWVENGYVKFSQCPTGGNWNSIPTTLSQSGSSQPQVKIDFNGNIIALWIENGVVYTNSKTLEGPWGSPVSLSSSNATMPQLAVDSNGNCVAVWIRNGSVESSTKIYGNNWSFLPDVLSIGNATYPTISISDNGMVMILWNEFSGQTYSIISTYKTIPNNWTSPVIVTSSLFNNPYCYINLNENSRGIAVWYNHATSPLPHRSIEYAFWSEINGWTAPATITSSYIADPEVRGVMADIDVEGNKIVLWKTRYLEDSFGIRTIIINTDGTLETPSDVVAYNLYAYASDLKLVPPNQALLAYMFYDRSSANLSIEAVHSNIGSYRKGYWSFPSSISSGAINGYPKIDATHYGDILNVAASWISYNGQNQEVVAAKGIINLLLPPSQLAVTQIANNFGIFTEYCNKLVWQASPSPGATGYVIYRNGEFFTEVSSAQPLEILDHNAGYNQSVTYGIATTNNAESQSETATVTFP